MITFKKVEIHQLDINEFNNFSDKNIYTTKEWLSFIKDSKKNIEIVVLKIFEDHNFLGYFVGCIFRKFGIKILGSPLKGTNTPFMAFNFYDKNKKYYVMTEVAKYFFSKYNCVYIEICDDTFEKDKLIENGFDFKESEGFRIDLTLTEKQIYSKFTQGVKSNINKFHKAGGKVEEDYTDDFIEEYWEQLIHVFEKHGLRPTYNKDRVKILVNKLREIDGILCLKAKTPDNKTIATLIVVGNNYLAVVFGGASYKEYHKEYRPNEALMWHAIKHWKDKGAIIFDFGGGGEFKKKYGGERFREYKVSFSKFPGMLMLRNIAYKSYKLLKKIKFSIGNILSKDKGKNVK